NAGFYLIIILITVGIVNIISSNNDQRSELTYDVFRSQLEQRNIDKVTARFDGYTYYITGTMKVNPNPSEFPSVEFWTRAPYAENVIEKLEAAGVKETYQAMQG